MKNFFMSIAVISAFSFIGCTDDDDNSSNDGTMQEEVQVQKKCESCTGEALNGFSIEVCEGENGNAFVSGVDTNIEYAGYIQTFEASGGSCK